VDDTATAPPGQPGCDEMHSAPTGRKLGVACRRTPGRVD